MNDLYEVDGTALSTHLTTEGRSGSSHSQNVNYLLRIGEVTELVKPSDPQNISGRLTEYRVLVQHRDVEARTQVQMEYYPCFLANPFGGLADSAAWTLRPRTRVDDETGVGNGSKVLLLCVNGRQYDAVILGGIRDPLDGDKDEEDSGHRLSLVFNGIKVSVNQEGELALSYLGKTTPDGKLDDSVDEDATGSTVKLLKDGSILLATRDGKQSILIDHANKKVSVTADEEWGLSVTGGKAVIESDGLEVGDDPEKTILGETYRRAEGDLNLDLAKKLGEAAAYLALAGGQVGAGFMLATAGEKLAQASKALLEAVKSLTNFEAQAPKYLSRKNKMD